MAGAGGVSEQLVVFHQSIQSIFDGWTGLQLAVRQGYGGPHGLEKARWMVDAVHNWFTENDDIEPFELEDFLADILDHEFDTIIEDDSLNVIATNICTNFQLCNTGRHQAVLDKIEKTPAARLGECVADENMEEGDDDEGSVQDSNMQAMLGGMRLGNQSQDQQAGTSQQNNSDMQGTSSSSSSSGATGGASPSGSPSDSRHATIEEDDGWTVVRKTKKK